MRRDVWIEGQKSAYVKDSQQTNRLGGDVAQPNRADHALARLPPERTGAFGPKSSSHLPVFAQQMVRKSQHQKHNGFGYRAHDSGGCDEYSDSMFGAGFEIDVVIANTPAADGTQPGNSRQGLRGHLRLQ